MCNVRTNVIRLSVTDNWFSSEDKLTCFSIPAGGFRFGQLENEIVVLKGIEYSSCPPNITNIMLTWQWKIRDDFDVIVDQMWTAGQFQDEYFAQA